MTVLSRFVIDDLIDTLIDRVFSWTSEYASSETNYEHPLLVYSKRNGIADSESLKEDLEILISFRSHRKIAYEEAKAVESKTNGTPR